MKIFYRVLSICLIVLSCNTDDDANRFKNFCSTDNPQEDLSWLKAEITQREQNINDDSKYCYIMLSIYKNQEIIIYGDCNPFVDKVIPIYNCEGTLVGYLGDENFPFEIINTGRIIWKTNDFVCEF